MTIDLQIIELIKSGNEQGLRLLYKHYAPALHGVALRQLRNEMYAEEALQNTFMKVWSKIDQYDATKSTLYTWMINILRNSSIDISRTQKFQVEKKTISIDNNVHSSSFTESREFSMDAKKLLEGMEDKYSVVLDYLYLRGYSQSELSEELDLPLGTIKTRVKKAIDILREKLDKESSLLFGFIILLLLLLKGLF